MLFEVFIEDPSRTSVEKIFSTVLSMNLSPEFSKAKHLLSALTTTDAPTEHAAMQKLFDTTLDATLAVYAEVEVSDSSARAHTCILR